MTTGLVLLLILMGSAIHPLRTHPWPSSSDGEGHVGLMEGYLDKTIHQCKHSQFAGGQNKNTQQKIIKTITLSRFSNFSPLTSYTWKHENNLQNVHQISIKFRSFSTSRRQSTGSSHSSETLRSGKVRKGPSLYAPMWKKSCRSPTWESSNWKSQMSRMYKM